MIIYDYANNLLKGNDLEGDNIVLLPRNARCFRLASSRIREVNLCEGYRFVKRLSNSALNLNWANFNAFNGVKSFPRRECFPRCFSKAFTLSLGYYDTKLLALSLDGIHSIFVTSRMLSLRISIRKCVRVDILIKSPLRPNLDTNDTKVEIRNEVLLKIFRVGKLFLPKVNVWIKNLFVNLEILYVDSAVF